MNDDIEKVTIVVTNGAGFSTRIITDEYLVADTQWPNLVQVFLEQLQGLGYKFFATPVEMALELDKFNQECTCAECGDCDEEKVPVVEEKKYPYTGMLKNKAGITVVEFTRDSKGRCVYTDRHEGNFIGQTSDLWDESLFTKVSK